jgi:hypothetical protein
LTEKSEIELCNRRIAEIQRRLSDLSRQKTDFIERRDGLVAELQWSLKHWKICKAALLREAAEHK